MYIFIIIINYEIAYNFVNSEKSLLNYDKMMFNFKLFGML